MTYLSNNTPEDWGYKFISNNFQQLLIDFEGTSNPEGNFQQRRRRAVTLISEIAGNESKLFYVRRREVGRNQGEEIWELILATDCDDSLLPEILQPPDKTLSIRGVVSENGNNGLQILSTRLLELESGRINSFALPRYIRLVLDFQNNNIGIPSEALAQIREQPFYSNFVPTDTQIRFWKNYLNIEGRTANRNQFKVAFVEHNGGVNQEEITFIVEPSSVEGYSRVTLTPENFWGRVRSINRSPIKLEYTDEQTGNNFRLPLGYIETFEQDQNRIDIRVSKDFGDSNFPQTGFLFYEDIGSLSQIKRKERALKDLTEGHTQNINLARFFFDATQATPLQEIVQLQRQDLLLSEANDGQIAAVEAVLAAKDLILLQGPPGTGKTTVIAEICYQVARQGGRVLLVSQANLAVDNALNRLSHHPELFPLRYGNADKVGEEGQHFLADRVIDRWIQNTSADCENKLSEKQRIVEGLEPLLNDWQRFIAYIETEEKFSSQQQELLENKENLKSEFQVVSENYNEVQQQYNQVEEIYTTLNNLFHQISHTIRQQKNEQISLAINELEQWRKTANSNIYRNLNQRLQQRLQFQEELIELPSGLQKIAVENNYEPWKSVLNQCEQRFNQLLRDCQEWDDICSIGNSIYNLVCQQAHQLVNVDLNEDQISRLTTTLNREIQNIGILQAIDKLQGFTRQTLAQLNQSNKKSVILAKLEAIKRKNLDIIRSGHPNANETVLYSITAETVNNIFFQWKTYLQQLQTHLKSQLENISIADNNLDTVEAPFNLLCSFRSYLESERNRLLPILEDYSSKYSYYQNEIQSIEGKLYDQKEYLNQERNWWSDILKNIPNHLKIEFSDSELYQTIFLRSLYSNFNDWQQKFIEAQNYLDRYKSIVSDWIARLRHCSIKDREDLSNIYLANVNIIGTTCVKAGERQFSQEYSEFDVVIIDEVSKSTPPELLIPAVKGQKLVMIGDYRQLPPMLNEQTIQEIGEEIGIPEDELDILNESWFQRQFKEASEQNCITKRLNTQYRMHPQIMEAINQFYDEGDGGLTCGLSDPDTQRAHNLETPVINQKNHILWVDMPQSGVFQENGQGTSYYNEQEINKIESLCQQMEESWSAKVAEGQPRKEIGIITFYGAQLKRIKTRIGNNRFSSLDITTGTVDIFQGMERPVIIVSMVRNNANNKVGFAKTSERVNVAFSRAKELLIIVGCRDLFTKIPIYQEVSNVVRRHGGFKDV